MSDTKGVLYIVATPIGNLADMTLRAQTVLCSVQLIAAEDTRNSQKLLNHFGIQTAMMSLHEHNERDRCDEILSKLATGQSIALISDAGTPLISDPGYLLVSQVQMAGFQVVPVPGPSALIAALSVAGLPTDRFCFEGFLPAKAGARLKVLQNLEKESRTMVFYESPHRLLDTLSAMVEVFGAERPITLAREITKLHETIRHASASELYQWVQTNPEQQKGESVLVVAGAEPAAQTETVEMEVERLLIKLLERLSVKEAAQLCSELTGQKKNALYDKALELRKKS